MRLRVLVLHGDLKCQHGTNTQMRINNAASIIFKANLQTKESGNGMACPDTSDANTHLLHKRSFTELGYLAKEALDLVDPRAAA